MDTTRYDLTDPIEILHLILDIEHNHYACTAAHLLLCAIKQAGRHLNEGKINVGVGLTELGEVNGSSDYSN